MQPWCLLSQIYVRRSNAREMKKDPQNWMTDMNLGFCVETSYYKSTCNDGIFLFSEIWNLEDPSWNAC